jgi:hypothetical protein
MNFAQLLLTLLPVGEQIAMLFVHAASSQQKYTVVTGTVNDLAPIAAGIAGLIAADKAAAAAAVHPANIPLPQPNPLV